MENEVGQQVAMEYLVTITTIAQSTGGYFPEESFNTLKACYMMGWVKKEFIDEIQANFTIMKAEDIERKVTSSFLSDTTDTSTVH